MLEIYEPREDSYLLAEQVKKYAKGRVLDVGTGSGIQAVTAKEAGADVLATDINPEAVKVAKKLGIKAICCDLLEKVKGKFDLIIFNPPYLPADGRNDDIRWSGGYEGIEVIMEFFKQAKNHLAENGKILFVFSSLSSQEKLKSFLRRLGFKLEILAWKRIFFEEIYVGKAEIITK